MFSKDGPSQLHYKGLFCLKKVFLFPNISAISRLFRKSRKCSKAQCGPLVVIQRTALSPRPIAGAPDPLEQPLAGFLSSCVHCEVSAVGSIKWLLIFVICIHTNIICTYQLKSLSGLQNWFTLRSENWEVCYFDKFEKSSKSSWLSSSSH